MTRLTKKRIKKERKDPSHSLGLRIFSHTLTNVNEFDVQILDG